ncbi:MAG: ribosome biogenesis GTPase Der [Rhodospirillaceae bacterium]|nr:ribosome biogenesis GTPase Der [Rhodospirillaceae bacterium]
MSFKLVIVGRPNVGKSTLFNRLVGRRLALVHDRPGVTRDRREGEGHLADLTFRVIDTAGLEDSDKGTLEGRMRGQTERAVAEADVALMVIDARVGVTPMDDYFADLLRRGSTPIILAANKCEGNAAQAGLYEAFSLGLGEPVALSAEHGQGLNELYDALLPYGTPVIDGEDLDPDAELEPGFLEAAEVQEGLPDGDDEHDELGDRPLQLAIVGRPNTGKSTLVNRLLGEDRVLTGPEPGVTRDAIPIDWEYKGRPVRLVDTAGLRKKAKVNDVVEKLSALDTLRAVDLAEVVVLVLDADAILDKQDLTIAARVIDEGRSLVIAVNKWDAASNRSESLLQLKEKLAKSLTQVRGVPTITISAKTGSRVSELMDTVFKTREIWNTRVKTAALNQWLDDATQKHPPPLSKQKRRIKLRYVTQVKARPPTFILFTSRPVDLPTSYHRYLMNDLRDTFGFEGVPLRLHVRKPDNPYDTRSKRG